MPKEGKYHLRDTKEALRSHLPFIEEMLVKVKNTAFEAKWQTMLEIISSDKFLTTEQITKLESTISNLKDSLKNKKVASIQLTQEVKKEMPENPQEVEFTQTKIATKEEVIVITSDESDNDVEKPSSESSKMIAQKQDEPPKSLKSIPEPSHSSEIVKNGSVVSTKVYRPGPLSSKYSAHQKNSSSLVPNASSAQEDPKVTPLIIKVEKNNSSEILCQKDIETEYESEEKEETRSPKRQPKKTKRRKRVPFSDSDESLDDRISRRISKKKKTNQTNGETMSTDLSIERTPSPPLNSSTVRNSVDSTSSRRSASKENDPKVSAIKNLLEKLSQGDPDNSKNLLNDFENIIGKEGFTTLKSLFLESSKTKPTEHEDSRSSGNVSENEPLNKLIQKNADFSSPNKKKRKKKSEAEKLKQDVLEMFICDGVLKAQGLRNKKRVPYMENNDLNDFDFDGSRTTEEPLLDDADSQIEKMTNDVCDQELEENVDSQTEDLEKSSRDEEASGARSIMTSHNNLEQKYKLKKCSVNLIKLDVHSMIMAIDTGTILPAHESNELKACEEVAPHDETQAEPNPFFVQCTEMLKPAECEDVKPSIESLKLLNVALNCFDGEIEIITIDDDDDTPSHTQVPAFQTVSEPSFLKTPSSKTISGMEISIYNLSFVKCRGGIFLKCNTERCTFQTFDEPLFQYHIQSKHILVKWSGSCNSCKSSVGNIGPLLSEYEHMSQAHILKVNGDSTSTTLECNVEKSMSKRGRKRVIKLPTALEVKSSIGKKRGRGRPKRSIVLTDANDISNKNDSSLACKINVVPSTKRSEVSQSKPVEPPAKQPESPKVKSPRKFAIKFKNLPGDKLSTSNNTSSPIATSIPISDPLTEPLTMLPYRLTLANQQHETVPPRQTEQLPLPVADLNHNSQASTQTNSVPKPANSVSKRYLRPWLTLEKIKIERCVAEMLKKDGLIDLYKCMGTFCEYHTNESLDFWKHLQLHDSVHHADKAQWTKCSYCNFSTESITDLMAHISKTHAFDKYACTKCFYRSATMLFVCLHQSHFHEDNSRRMYECEGASNINYKEALAEAKTNRSKFITPITCASCKSKFFTYEVFMEHFKKEHGEDADKLRHRCNKCLEETHLLNLRHHLENCHNVVRFVCLQCRYGSNQFETFKFHLFNNHPNKLPFFCERVHEKGAVPTRVESLSLRLLGVTNESELNRGCLINKVSLSEETN